MLTFTGFIGPIPPWRHILWSNLQTKSDWPKEAVVRSEWSHYCWALQHFSWCLHLPAASGRGAVSERAGHVTGLVMARGCELVQNDCSERERR